MSFLTNTLLKPVIAGLLSQYNLDKLGSVTAVDLDNSSRTLEVTLQLDGENTPIELEFRYAKAGQDQVEITEVKSSRAWIATLASEFVPSDKKRFKVPAVVGRLL
jgi:hypothetical protein